MSNDKKFDPENLYEKLMKASNAAELPHFRSSPSEETKVDIRPDKSIAPAKFLPDSSRPGHFLAHPVTIAAMRKDIFVGGAEMFEDLEVLYTCEGCKKELDLQFWIFCPYCEAKPRYK
ncbi:MAG: hypothetical protein KC493_01260 [Bacteriovoracaceae bacterium]|nr:hypothetical protein [Bacteriovoracaceae bacterium]